MSHQKASDQYWNQRCCFAVSLDPNTPLDEATLTAALAQEIIQRIGVQATGLSSLGLFRRLVVRSGDVVRVGDQEP
jgi:hypothetical protein